MSNLGSNQPAFGLVVTGSSQSPVTTDRAKAADLSSGNDRLQRRARASRALHSDHARSPLTWRPFLALVMTTSHLLRKSLSPLLASEHY